MDNNNSMLYLYIFLIIIVFIIIMPIKIRVIRNESYNDIDVYFIKIFNMRLDLDGIIKKFFFDKNSSISLNSILYNIGLFIKSSNIIKDTIKQMKISKLTCISQVNLKNEKIEMLGIVTAWNSICYLRDFIYKYFKEINNEYYSVQTNNKKINSSFEIILNFRLIYIILSVLKNFKDIKKIIKFIKKGKEKNV